MLMCLCGVFFMSNTIRSHILELTAEQAKAANANIDENDLSAIVDEAVEWARNH